MKIKKIMKNFTLLFFLVIIIITGCCTNTKNKNATIFSLTKDTTIQELYESIDLCRDNPSIVTPLVLYRTITVGGTDADIHGFTSQAIQTAINVLKSTGGGTVKLFPGNYEVIAPVQLFDNITLEGTKDQTILKKSKGVHTHFAVDAGYGELQLTVEDASPFSPRMGIQISDSQNNQAWDVTTTTITKIKGNTIYIDNYLIRDYSVDNKGTVSNSCSVISAVGVKNVAVKNLSIDGSKDNNDILNGCRGGGIYLHKIQDVLIENVTVNNFNGDGISWQITENVVVRNCEVSGCTNAGLHPGTGTLYTIIEGNHVHNNDNYGLFVCWRVRHGIVRDNKFIQNGQSGICTGHMDTDMLFEKNIISENGHIGVDFRNESKANAPHRNTFKGNIVENNGWATSLGYGFLFNSPAEGVVLENNVIRNTRGSNQKAAVFIGRYGLPVTLKENLISEHPEGGIVLFEE